MTSRCFPLAFLLMGTLEVTPGTVLDDATTLEEATAPELEAALDEAAALDEDTPAFAEEGAEADAKLDVDATGAGAGPAGGACLLGLGYAAPA